MIFNRLVGGVAWKVFKICENGVGIGELSLQMSCFFLEPHILSNNLIMGLTHLVQLVDEAVIFIPEANNLGPELIEVPLLAHPWPPGRFPVGDHPPLLSLIVDAGPLLLCLVRVWVAADARAEFLIFCDKSGDVGGIWRRKVSDLLRLNHGGAMGWGRRVTIASRVKGFYSFLLKESLVVWMEMEWRFDTILV